MRLYSKLNKAKYKRKFIIKSIVRKKEGLVMESLITDIQL